MSAQLCEWCGETVEAGEQSRFFSQAMHEECGFRAATGSVAHVLHRCSCYLRGSTLEDPPNMTKREAARAAFHLFRQIARWYGDDVLLDLGGLAAMGEEDAVQ